MDILEAKQIVIDAGLRLVKEGLIARTWGNISVRIDETRFVITPSGRAYDKITPRDVVLMNIADLSYEGDIKPSGEKGVHAEAYKQSLDIKAVIHTHQLVASTVAAARRDITVVNPTFAKILGGTTIRCAAYGLPNTKQLKRATAAALQGRKACLMANHGVVCVGATMDEAFLVAQTLEKASQAFIEDNFARISGRPGDTAAMHAYYLKNCA